jgi:putative phage-type endonuclease
MSLQRTPEWFAARLGKLTASRIDDATAKTRNGWGASRKNYMAELLTERMTGKPAPQSWAANAAVQWGLEHERAALDVYEFENNVTVEEVSFCPHPLIDMAGASPDGLIAVDGLVEVKCPNTATHLETIISGKIDQGYVKQMQWQMACAGRLWCDFVSFDPRLEVEDQFWTARVLRDNKMIATLEAMAAEFLGELDVMVAAIRAKRKRRAQAA